MKAREHQKIPVMTLNVYCLLKKAKRYREMIDVKLRVKNTKIVAALYRIKASAIITEITKTPKPI